MRKAIGIQPNGVTSAAVITGLMRVVTLGGQNNMIQWRLTLTFIRFFFLICSRFRQCLPLGLIGTQAEVFTFMISHE